jgi:hypothetical protein
MNSQGNLQEGRHSLGRETFHSRRGELRQRYYEGMEDQLGALGLVLNAIVLFNTRDLDAAITELRAGGYEVRDEDAARLSASMQRSLSETSDAVWIELAQLDTLPVHPAMRRWIDDALSRNQPDP